MGAWTVPEIRVSVRVKPGSSRGKVGGSHNGALIVAVSAQPVDGAANQAVIKALAHALDVKVRDLRVVSGHTARTKTIEIELQVDRLEEISKKLASLLSE
jgi:uncharacterized protein (TIGR00251 family)